MSFKKDVGGQNLLGNIKYAYDADVFIVSMKFMEMRAL